MGYSLVKRHAEQRPCSTVHVRRNVLRNVKMAKLVPGPSRGGSPGMPSRAELPQPVLRVEPGAVTSRRARGRTQGSDLTCGRGGLQAGH